MECLDFLKARIIGASPHRGEKNDMKEVSAPNGAKMKFPLKRSKKMEGTAAYYVPPCIMVCWSVLHRTSLVYHKGFCIATLLETLR